MWTLRALFAPRSHSPGGSACTPSLRQPRPSSSSSWSGQGRAGISDPSSPLLSETFGRYFTRTSLRSGERLSRSYLGIKTNTKLFCKHQRKWTLNILLSSFWLNIINSVSQNNREERERAMITRSSQCWLSLSSWHPPAPPLPAPRWGGWEITWTIKHVVTHHTLPRILRALSRNISTFFKGLPLPLTTLSYAIKTERKVRNAP